MISKTTFATFVFVGALACAATRPVLAHHSFSAEFDDTKCGEITGTLVGVDWQNPHPYFFVEGKNAGGAPVKMTFQTSSIANMTRRACASKNGADNRYAGSWIRLPNEPIHRVGQDVEGIFGSNN